MCHDLDRRQRWVLNGTGSIVVVTGTARKSTFARFADRASGRAPGRSLHLAPQHTTPTSQRRDRPFEQPHPHEPLPLDRTLNAQPGAHRERQIIELPHRLPHTAPCHLLATRSPGRFTPEKIGAHPAHTVIIHTPPRLRRKRLAWPRYPHRTWSRARWRDGHRTPPSNGCCGTPPGGRSFPPLVRVSDEI